jgi:MFS family permease
MTRLRALHHRNFRLFFFGQGVSLMGTWMQIMAMSWLVYRLTNSPFLLGAVNFASQAPSLLLGPFAGVVSDRFPRRATLVWTQTRRRQTQELWWSLYTAGGQATQGQ